MALERMSPEVLELFGINPETEYYVRDNRMRLDNDFLGASIKRKIPAREVAGLLGDNPYSSRFETALDILRQAAAKSSLDNSKDFDIPFVDNEFAQFGREMEPRIITWLKNNGYSDVLTPSEYFGRPIPEEGPNRVFDFYDGTFSEPSNHFFSGKWDARSSNTIFEIKTGTKRKWNNWVKEGKHPQSYRRQAAIYARLSGLDDVVLASTYSTKKERENPSLVALDSSRVFIEKFKVSEEFPNLDRELEDVRNIVEELRRGVLPEFDTINDFNYKDVVEKHFKARVDAIKASGNLLDYPSNYETDNPALQEALKTEQFRGKLNKVLTTNELDPNRRRVDISSIPIDSAEKIDAGKLNARYASFVEKFNAVKDYFEDNMDDYTRIRPDTIVSILRQHSTGYTSMLGKSRTFSYRDTPELAEFFDSIKKDFKRTVLTRQLWESESNQVVSDELERILANGIEEELAPEEISDSLKYFLKGNLTNITKTAENSSPNGSILNNSDLLYSSIEEELAESEGIDRASAILQETREDQSKLYARAAQNLDEEDFTIARKLLDHLVVVAKQWQLDNSMASKDWQDAHRNILNEYIDEMIFDPVRAHQDQVKRISQLNNRIIDGLFSGRRMTVRDAFEIYSAATADDAPAEVVNQYRSLREFFENNKPVAFARNLSNEADNGRSLQRINVLDRIVDEYRTMLEDYESDRPQYRGARARINKMNRVRARMGKSLIDTTNPASDDTRRAALKNLTSLGSLDIGLRINDDGSIYSTSDLEHGARDTLRLLSRFFPLNLFKFKGIDYNDRTRPDEYFFKAGTKQVQLAHLLGQEDSYLKESVLFKKDRLYRVVGNDPKNYKLEEIAGTRDKFTIISTRVGMGSTLAKTALGRDFRPDPTKTSDNILSVIQRLADTDIEKLKRSHEMGNFTEVFGNFSQDAIDFVRQDQGIITAVIQNTSVSNDKETERSIYHAFNTLAGVDRFANYIQANTTGFKKDTSRKLLAALGNISSDTLDETQRASLERAKQALETAMKASEIKTLRDTEELLAAYVPDHNVVEHNFKSHSLSQTISRFFRDEVGAINRRNTKYDMAATVLNGQYSIMNFNELLERQLSTEAVLNIFDLYNGDNRESVTGTAELFKLFDSVLEGKDASDAKDLAVISKFLDITTLDAQRTDRNARSTYLEERNAFFNKYIDLAQDNSEDAQLVKKQMRNLFEAYFDKKGDVGIDARGKMREFIEEKLLIQKGYGLRMNSRYLIKQINQGHYAKAFDYTAKRTIDFARQFVAGTDDLKHFSTYSLFFLERMASLNDALNKFDKIEFTGLGLRETFNIGLGLGLHNEKDLASGLAIARGLLIKRALPTYLLYNSMDFIDDFAKEVTGQGVYEATTSGLANNYLLLKKITGALGLDESLKSLSSDNAILQHYASFFGSDKAEWNTYAEQKKYYEEGYSPIRKAAFWTFGSSNEFRGGKVSYYEPNTLRMLRSDFRKESLYNGEFFTKWNPMRVIDPYYMEKLHYEDRPYPVSGSLFSDSTPWGVMLNPVIGEAIKPKVRMHEDRLVGGMDVRALIANINENIRNKANGNSNLFMIKNGKLRSFDFTSFDHPSWDTDIYSFENGEAESGGDYKQYFGAADISSTSEDYHMFSVDNQNPSATLTTSQPSVTTLTFTDKMNIEAAKGGRIGKLISSLAGAPLSSIRNVNEEIRQRATYDKEQGLLIESKFNNPRGGIEDMLENADDIADIINETSKNDYIQQMAISSRMIYGFYGYMTSLATGWGSNNYKRVATSADMTSTSRWFWDSGIGGLGGDVMEIGRRVIPEFRRFDSKNPLMNTMPDWMPERYRFGDPYTAVPVGEARMPGRGYESLNVLHPDMFGNYGAFDRFKILADVAPTSPEYKFWKKIATKTVKDPKLKEEMAEIRERVKKQTSQYEFEDYKYVGRGVNKENVVISEILSNGQFKIIGSNETYKLAGVTINSNEEETRQQVFQRYVAPGQKVQIITDENEYYGRNKDKAKSISAAIITENGDNISQMMLQNKDARIRKSEQSAAATWGKHGGMVNGLNYLSELFMHADIPIIHNRWFRANDAIEEWKDEYVYGSAFQSWDDIVGSYVLPTLRKGSESKFWMGLGIISDIMYSNSDANQFGSKHLLNMLNNVMGKELNTGKLARGSNFARSALKTFNRYTDRFSLFGSLTGGILHFGSENRSWLKQVPYRRAGVLAGLTYASVNNTNSLAIQVISTSRLAYLAMDVLGEKSFSKKMNAAKIGAIIGSLRWAGDVKLLADDESANTYIPEKVRKKWKIEDYFDRLEYLKYEALFNKAADKALEEEGVDIKKILLTQSKEARDAIKTKKEIKEHLDDLRDNNSYEAKKVKFELFERLKALEKKSSVPFTGGDYTKSAIMYYNAMKSTMYALDETSSMADIIRALPKTDREFFMKFLEERDPARRKEILRISSPQIRKALNMLWYKKVEEPESNESYFSNHTLPSPMWSGWNPNIDLANVKAKVIENIGGQIASDYGIYASQYRDAKVINAPNINMSEGGGDFVSSALKIQAILNGFGLIGTEVNVEPQQSNALDVVVNLSKIIPYNINQAMKNVIH